MKIKNYIISLFIALLIIGMPIQISANKLKDNKVIVEKSDTNLALNRGCILVKELKHVNVLNCNADAVNSLNLQPELNLHTLDAGTNSQVRADLVFSSGNTGLGRKVVILDSGYNYNHSELSSSYLGGKDFVNNDFDPLDDLGHGTHVAGLITADGINSNAKGVAPGTGIISGKIVNTNGIASLSTLIDSIYWAVDGNDGVYGTSDDFNADAISVSLGTDPPYTYGGYCDDVFPTLTNAVNYAVSKNVAVVIAAGNHNVQGVSIPGCISSAITVGAVDNLDNIAYFSARGSALDVVAPGVNLVSTWLNNEYTILSGTSMAAPIVTGTIALIKYKHPTYTVMQVRDALTKTAKDIDVRGFDSNTGYGRIDAYAAVNYSPTKKCVKRCTIAY